MKTKKQELPTTNIGKLPERGGEKMRYLLWYLFGFICGMMLTSLIIYKIEINTLNQALDSVNYCYQTYALK